MNLYLVRHGDAEKTQPGKRDEDRRLLQKGWESIKIAADQWIFFIKKLDIICTSPYSRAVETAEIIAQSFKYEKEILKDNTLAPGSLTKELITLNNSLGGEDIMIIGHQPDLSEHVSNLISSKGALVDFKKGTLVKISFNGKASVSKGYLEYLIPSEVFLK